MTYLEMIYKAGPVMWIILAAFLLAMTFFLKKVMQFHQDEINVLELLRGLRWLTCDNEWKVVFGKPVFQKFKFSKNLPHALRRWGRTVL